MTDPNAEPTALAPPTAPENSPQPKDPKDIHKPVNDALMKLRELKQFTVADNLENWLNQQLQVGRDGINVFLSMIQQARSAPRQPPQMAAAATVRWPGLKPCIKCGAPQGDVDYAQARLMCSKEPHQHFQPIFVVQKGSLPSEQEWTPFFEKALLYGREALAGKRTTEWGLRVFYGRECRYQGWVLEDFERVMGDIIKQHMEAGFPK